MTTETKLKRRDRFEAIKSTYFLNPHPNTKREVAIEIARAQSVLDVLLGDVFAWYIGGTGRDGRLDEAIKAAYVTLERTHRRLATKRGTKADKSAPYTYNLEDQPPPAIPLEASNPNLALDQALVDLDKCSPWSIRFNHHFIGELHPQGNLLALGASIVASFVNANGITAKASPCVTTWENHIVSWVAELIARRTGVEPNKKFKGHIVSGGTVANLTAMFIAVARFREWKKNVCGVQSVEPLILVSPHSHFSLRRCASILGLDYDRQFVKIRTKDYWRVAAGDVAEELGRARRLATHSGRLPMLVCALAGATDTGHVDELDAMKREIDEHNKECKKLGMPPVMFHVDAAYGGAFLAVEDLKRTDGKHLFHGIESADTLTIDGHKYFYCSYPCGGIFVKNKKLLKYLDQDMPYLSPTPTSWEDKKRERGWERHLNGLLGRHPASTEMKHYENIGKETLEGSRGTHGVKQLYVILRAWGADGLEALLNHTIEMTTILRSEIRATQKDAGQGSALELIAGGQLNQTLFRYVGSWANRATAARFVADDGVNFQIPRYLQRCQLGPRTKTTKSPPPTWPFYVGIDTVPSLAGDTVKARRQAMTSFVNGIQEMNERQPCPNPELEVILNYAVPKKGPPPGKMRVLKAIITHPYTDRDTIRAFVRAIQAAGDYLVSTQAGAARIRAKRHKPGIRRR